MGLGSGWLSSETVKDLALNCITKFFYDTSLTDEARLVERARIVLACLGKNRFNRWWSRRLPSMQGIERACGFVETDNGAVVGALKSICKWHGTLNPFAALEVGSGLVQAKIAEYVKRVVFQSFLMA